jgi:hypothetical protein
MWRRRVRANPQRRPLALAEIGTTGQADDVIRGVLLCGGAGAIVVAGCRRLHNWGATAAERHQVMVGDGFVADPADVVTRAVTVHAATDQVWRWLVQIGQDRGGMYSYQWLENLFGLGIHNTDEVRTEWQQLHVGDEVRLVPAGRLGRRAGYALPVAHVDPGSNIVLRQQPPTHPWDAVWSFHILPADAGTCRLISRSRSARGGRTAQIAAALMDPVAAVMTRKMLLGIKSRAERAANASS